MSYHIIIHNVVGIEMIVKALREHAHDDPDPVKQIAYRDLADGIECKTLFIDDATKQSCTLEDLARTEVDRVGPGRERPKLTLVKRASP